MAANLRDAAYSEPMGGVATAPAFVREERYGQQPFGPAFEPVYRIGPIGSRSDTLYYTPKCGGLVNTGCFTGTLAEFEEAVNKRHAFNAHGQVYRAAIEFFRAIPDSYPHFGDAPVEPEPAPELVAEVPRGPREGFLLGLGTIRECIDCGALVAGGPNRCLRCVEILTRDALRHDMEQHARATR